MTDPGLPPRPRSLNLLESLVLEEEEKDKNKGLPNVTIPTSGIESSANSDSQDANEQQLDRENSASTYKEFKMKDIDTTLGVKSNPHAGFKGKKFSKRRSRSNSSERGKKKGKLVRPFSADYKQEQRNKIMSKSNRPKTSKGPHMRKYTSSPRGKTRKERSKSPRSSSSDSYSDHFDDENDKKFDERRIKANDDFFDSDSGDNAQKDSKTDYIYRPKDNLDENKNVKKEKARLVSENSDGENKPGTSTSANGHISRSTERKQHTPKTIYKKKDGQQVTRSDSEGEDYERMVVVEDYSSSFTSSSEDESKSKDENTDKITNGTKHKHKSKKLIRRKKVLKPNTLIIDPDKYLEAKVHQKYLELEDLMTCSFVDQRKNVTRQQVYQMELLRDQYNTVSHGLPSSHVIIPRSLPGDVRYTGNRPRSGDRPWSGRRPRSDGRPSSGKWMQQLDSDEESYDRAYGTLRSVMDAEKARVTHAIRTDVIAVRPSSAKKKPKKKKKAEPTVKTTKEHHSEEEDVSEKPSLKSTTSSESTPRKKGPSIDDHLKYSKNEQLKKWLKEKNKIYRQQIKEEKMKKREEREKLINEANDKIEKRLESQKHVKKWMHRKNKELWRKHQEEKKREEAEKAERKRMEVNLPGDSMKIRPQSAPATGRADEIMVDEEKCLGEETPEYVKDQIHRKRELQEENKQLKLAKQEPHPPQTKFIYKRPVAGKIKFKMQQDRAKSPHGKEQTSQSDGSDKGMRLSYDDWLKKKRRDDSAKRREEERRKELAKSDPELDRIIPALAKKRVDNILNQRKRIDTGIKQYDEKANKTFGGSEHSGDDSGKDSEKGRPRSAYRLAGDKSEGPALTVKQVRPQTAPATRVPHPKKSVNSPRKAVIPQKPDAIMSNKDQSNPFTMPFPPELGVPKYVAERQRKIFADQINQRLAEAEHQEHESVEKTGNHESENKPDGTDLKIGEENVAEKIEDTKQPNITELMYSPKKKDDTSESSSEDTSESSSEDENTKHKEQEIQSKIKEDIKDDINKTTEQSAFEIENISKDENKITEDSHSGDDKIGEQSAFKDKESSQLLGTKQTEFNADIGIKNDNDMIKAKTFENLSDIGFGPPIIMSEDKDSDDESESDNENVSMSNSGTNTDSDKDVVTVKHEMSEENKLKAEHFKEDDSQHLVGILKENKGTDDKLTPEKVEDNKFAHSEAKADVTKEEWEDAAQREGATSHKRVSFNEQPTVFQSFESSSTDTITPEQPGELNAEEFGLDAQANDEEDFWPGEDGEKSEETLSFNIAGFELKAKVIKSDDNEEKDEENEKDDGKTTFITNPDKE